MVEARNIEEINFFNDCFTLSFNWSEPETNSLYSDSTRYLGENDKF